VTETPPEFIVNNVDKSKWFSSQLAKPFGPIWFGAKLSGHADVYKLSHDQLYLYVSRKVGFAEMAIARSRNVFGRMYNRMIGDRIDYIEISAAHLRQVYAVLEEDSHEAITPRGDYLLRLDVAKRARSRLKEIVEGVG
jgi:hypothetical protein